MYDLSQPSVPKTILVLGALGHRKTMLRRDQELKELFLPFLLKAQTGAGSVSERLWSQRKQFPQAHTSYPVVLGHGRQSVILVWV